MVSQEFDWLQIYHVFYHYIWMQLQASSVIDRTKLKERCSWTMRSIQVPPDQLELFHGESHEDAILLRMAKKYRRLLYQNRLLFFVKCSIDPEGRSTVHKYRAEYGVHAYEKLAERCKELLEEQS